MRTQTIKFKQRNNRRLTLSTPWSKAKSKIVVLKWGHNNRCTDIIWSQFSRLGTRTIWFFLLFLKTKSSSIKTGSGSSNLLKQLLLLADISNLSLLATRLGKRKTLRDQAFNINQKLKALGLHLEKILKPRRRQRSPQKCLWMKSLVDLIQTIANPIKICRMRANFRSMTTRP